jgi:hypothetical protein
LIVAVPPGTVKEVLLESTPQVVCSETIPEVALAGTVAVICVGEFTINDAEFPLKRTDVTEKKFVPVIITVVPAAPLAGENDERTGGSITVSVIVFETTGLLEGQTALEVITQEIIFPLVKAELE